MPTLNPVLEKVYWEDKHFLENTAVPIITVSGTYREDLKSWHHQANNETDQDVVFSRAHFSMALGVAIAAWHRKLDHQRAWLADPTNFVSKQNWHSIKLTEEVGEMIARHPFLKKIKSLIDQFGRQRLPILDSITQPLIYLTNEIDKPILSFHIAAGNIMIEQGKTVLQVITDPYVRYDYLKHAANPRLFYAVFDNKTKTDLLEQAEVINQPIAEDHVFVTGPPIDPRIVNLRNKKYPWRSGPIKLVITTGGLGTNKLEILAVLDQLLPELRKRQPLVKLLVYAGTHADIEKAIIDKARAYHVAIDPLADRRGKMRLIYHPQIFNANELLIKYGFPWADGFITKPSGDMAYDAAASGHFLLTLEEWGEWEHHIREFFEQKGIGRVALVDKILAQLQLLATTDNQRSQAWIEKAMLHTHHLNKRFYHGAENILQSYKKVAEIYQKIQKNPKNKQK